MTSITNLQAFLEHKFQHKKIGVWGFGVVGKAALHYLANKDCSVGLLEKRDLTPEEHALINSLNVQLFKDEPYEREKFLQWADTIIPSAGIDLRNYQQYNCKWLSELDIFAHENKKFSIGITGTIGKTSTTWLLGQTLKQAGKQVVLGGNIGTSLFELLVKNEPGDIQVLELSSFQLEQSHYFAPDLAIITNIYPKHLDRHETFEKYYNAKLNLIKYQHQNQHALIPASLYTHIRTQVPLERKLSVFFDLESDLNNFLEQINTGDSVYYYSNTQAFMHYKDTIHIQLTSDNFTIPTLSYKQNWLIISAALNILSYQPSLIQETSYTLPAHRLTPVATISGVTFYDDSKGTSVEATLAAVNRLKNKPIILLLGGISDGLSRENLIKELAPLVKSIHCFGAEAPLLAQWCKNYNITTSEHHTLQEAVLMSTRFAQEGDQIVLSPAGPSYDLFTDYKQRGLVFQEIVQKIGLQAVNN